VLWEAVRIEEVWCGLCGVSVWGLFIEPFFFNLNRFGSV
jgi:hypothetical protein